jgi:hypothetical protein
LMWKVSVFFKEPKKLVNKPFQYYFILTLIA